MSELVIGLICTAILIVSGVLLTIFMNSSILSRDLGEDEVSETNRRLRKR